MRDPFIISHNKYLKDKGDDLLRLDYPMLSKKSIVFDVGGYKGDFAEAINKKYGCKVYLFEPHPEYYTFCVDKFSTNNSIVPLNYGLSNKNSILRLSDEDDGSSFDNSNHFRSENIPCEVKDFFDVVNSLRLNNIDLMKINIEGGEFSLLLYIAEKDRMDIVDQYQIQFHNFIDGAIIMRNKITNHLAKTHFQTWCYPFVWENWQRK